MKTCPECGGKVSEEALVCKHCGSKLKLEEWDAREVLYYYGRIHKPISREEIEEEKNNDKKEVAVTT